MTWHPERIGEAVRRELGRFGPAGAMGTIVAAWPEVVGPAIAANAWPARCGRDGTLHVAAVSSVWAFELTQLEAAIRERLVARLGDAAPARLRFVPGRLPALGGEFGEDDARIVPEVSASARSAGERIAAGIENEALRSLVARAAAASLARGGKRSDDRPLW